MEGILKVFTLERLLTSVVVLVVAVLAYKLTQSIASRFLRIDKKKKGRNTYISLVYSIIRYIYAFIVALVILQVYGVDIPGMMTGVGILTAALGLAFQDTLKDVIRGFSLVAEDYLKIGEYVTIGEFSGTVISSGIRSTKLKDGLTGDIVTIANRNIDIVKVSADLINLDLPLPYELKLSDAEKIINEIVEECRKVENVAECEYLGVSNFSPSSIDYRIYIKTKHERIVVKRACQRVILQILEKHKTSIPYQQVVIRNE